MQILGVGGPYWVPPPYSPAYWNDWTTSGTHGVQWNNNCYNYGGNRITWTNAQPGLASGNIHPSPFTAADIALRLVNDGWEPTTAYATSSEGKMKVYVALAPLENTPGVYWDFHFYRQDYGGGWSHKRGQAAADDKDASSVTITSPETCDRDIYTYGMGYYFVPSWVPGYAPQSGNLTNIR